MIQLENRWADLDEIWHGLYVVYTKIVYAKEYGSVYTTYRSFYFDLMCSTTCFGRITIKN
jgi:hypothetical protein